MNRSRKVYRSRIGEGENLNLSGQPPWNATLLQIGIHYDTAPITAGVLTVQKISGVHTLHNLLLYSDDPSIDGKTQDIILCQYEFLKGDSILAEWTNADDIDMGIEIIFREGQ